MLIDFALHMQSIQLSEPPVGIDDAWQGRESRQMGEGAAWRTIATGQALMRALHVVVLHEGLCDCASLLQVGRPIQGETLRLLAAMIALHKGILLPMMRITDADLDPQTGAKTDQGCRKIPACWTAHPTRITIQGDALGSTILG